MTARLPNCFLSQSAGLRVWGDVTGILELHSSNEPKSPNRGSSKKSVNVLLIIAGGLIDFVGRLADVVSFDGNRYSGSNHRSNTSESFCLA
jgi:hypothetical protein